MSDMMFSFDESNGHKLPADVRAFLENNPDIDASEIEEVWRLASNAKLVESSVAVDHDRFESMRARVNRAIERSHVEDRPPRRSVRSRIAWIAATSMAVLAFALVLWFRPFVVETPLAVQSDYELPDGTVVSLNSGSRLSYRRTFGWRERQVRLDGEAYFDVTRGTRPFTVSTFNGAITVLGTRFNVRAWSTDDLPETEVVLEEGSVRFSSRSREADPVVLEPGEMSRLGAERIHPTVPVTVDTGKQIAWRRGGMLFEDRPIGAVLDEVERRFDTHILVTPASIRLERITLLFDSVDDPEEILSTVASVRGYTFETTASGYLLSAH